MSHCPYCKKKIAMSKAFCSKSCKENYFQLIAIQVPKLFLKRIYVFCNKEEREREIVKFAQRHNWRLDLCKNKIEEEAIKVGYIEALA
jgi:glutaredoxin